MGFAGALIACGPQARGGDDDGGGGPDGGGEVPDGRGGGDGGGDSCASGTELVYTIDQSAQRLSRFDPMTKTFQDLGSLSCPSTMGSPLPFSMSVDRHGVAWVLYTSGELFRVELSGLACTRTAWASPNGLRVFGMGFSTDQAGGSTETLYVGGAQSQSASSFTLAKLDTATLTATPLGTHPALPEMTGTGGAELWGFFPGAPMPRVVQFDKATGAIARTFPQPSLQTAGRGYAFAHWGGDFWIFLSTTSDTTVSQVDGATGAILGTTAAPGRAIVGAGVSTCAPVIIL